MHALVPQIRGGPLRAVAHWLFPFNRTDLAGMGWSLGWLAGFVIRLVLIFLVVPVTYAEWFVPFLVHWGFSGSIDGWTGYVAAGGAANAFPYGLPYGIVFGPLTILGKLFGGLFGAGIGLGATVLILDLWMSRVISILAERRHAMWAYLAYWLNPVVIFIGYFHGQLDVLPVFLVVVAILQFRRQHFLWCGLSLGLAVSAKFAMLIAVPFFAIAVLKDRRFASQRLRLAGGFAAGMLATALVILSPGFRQMVIGTPESTKLFATTLGPVGGDVLFVLPLALAALMLTAWRISRYNARAILVYITLAMFLVYLLTPAAPGWALWVVPFLVVIAPAHGRLSILVTFGFFFAIVLHHLRTASGVYLTDGSLVGPFPYDVWLGSPLFGSAVYSAMIAAGIVLVVQTLRRDVFQSPFFLATRSPVAISIAGDSGSGKDTLAESLLDIFGRERTAHISGDDYHIWDRHKPMWGALTHLDPRANHLNLLQTDIDSLLSWNGIMKRHYDHSVGRMTRPEYQPSREVVIVSGLHALVGTEQNKSFDARIFLDINEDLRRALKIRRDVLLRGHTLEAVKQSLERRHADAVAFIHPQKQAADIVFSLQALRQADLDEALNGRGTPDDPIDMTLAVGLSETVHSERIENQLTSVLGAKLCPLQSEDGRKWFEITTAHNADATGLAFHRTIPGILDILTLQPKWAPGLAGVMQLVTAEAVCRRRRLQNRDPEGA